jgi:hypothetical protein
MKKTLHDLLLSRHASLAPHLDTLRHAALTDATPIPASQLLRAIFFPQRRLWLGLAAAWLVILALTFTQHPTIRPNPLATLYATNWSANQARLHALLSKTGPYR